MAGARQLRSKTWQGWYRDHTGKRQFFTLSRTAGKRDTLQTAQELETHHRKMALGVLPLPSAQDRHHTRPVEDVVAEYLRWGAFQGGRKGRAWSPMHLHNRTTQLAWWQTTLKIRTLADCLTMLPAVERALQDLHSTDGRTGKTLANYRESLSAFCEWCVTRHYLQTHPLHGSTPIDTTPQSHRRAMTAEDIQRLLDHCPLHRRLLYETACCTGLRANELRQLAVGDLDLDQGGLRLDPSWTKNRTGGLQPIGAYLRSFSPRLSHATCGWLPQRGLARWASHARTAHS